MSALTRRGLNQAACEWAPAVVWIDENLRLGALRSAAAGLTVRSITDKGVAVTLAWSGGTAPYLVQKRASLGSGEWFNVLTTSDTSVTVPKEGSSGFFRVQDKATATVSPFSALLSGDAEIPPVRTTGHGLATLALEGNRLSYQISFSGLSGPATGAHIHGEADALNVAGVIVPFIGPFGSAGVVVGATTLNADQITALKKSRLYLNFHTLTNAGGEIRGRDRAPPVAREAHGRRRRASLPSHDVSGW